MLTLHKKYKNVEQPPLDALSLLAPALWNS